MGVEARELRSVFGIFESPKARVALLLSVGALGLSACGDGQESDNSEFPAGNVGTAPAASVGSSSETYEGESVEGSTLEERAMAYCESLLGEGQAVDYEGNPVGEYTAIETGAVYTDPETGETLTVTCSLDD